VADDQAPAPLPDRVLALADEWALADVVQRQHSFLSSDDAAFQKGYNAGLRAAARRLRALVDGT
jgi:hypothetical protein